MKGSSTMFKNLLSKIEEKYVFNISQYFWHIFIALASLVLIAGVLILLWGIIPSIKGSVEKQAYPPVVQVSSNEIIAVLEPGSKKNNIANATPTESLPTPVTYSDPNEKDYNLSLDSLRKLIPSEKYSWNSSGYWYYPYGEQYYNYYRNTIYANNYRQWRISELGITDRLDRAYTSSNAVNFNQKKQLLDEFLNVIKRFPEDKRIFALKSIASYTGSSISETIENTKALNAAVNIFGSNDTDFLFTLASFGSSNPNEGRTFILYANKALVHFPSEYHLDVLRTMMRAFYSYFNNKVDRQIEVTDLFIKDIKNYKPESYTKAMEVYYNIIFTKNSQRERAIENIENEYSLALAKANANYEIAKVEKAKLRINGLYLAGVAISAIAVLALILVMLSIQRYVKRIDESVKADRS